MSWKNIFKTKQRTPLQQAKSDVITAALIAPVYIYLFVMFAVWSQDAEVMEVITKELLMQVVIAFGGLLMVFKLLDVAASYYNYHKAKKVGEIKP